MANVGTSTVAYATHQQAGTLVFIASDGTAGVLCFDGTNQIIAYSASPYSSWASATIVAGTNMLLSGVWRAGTSNIDEVTGAASTMRPNVRLLTKSGSTWTVGTATNTSTTVAGTAGVGNVSVYAGQDPFGRYWLIVGGASTYTTTRILWATTPTGTWTEPTATAQTGDVNLPVGGQIGNFLLTIYWNGTALQWHRLDNSASTIGSWSTGATIANLTGSPNASSVVCFRPISATSAVLTYSTGSGIYAQIYDVGTDTFGTATQLSSNGSDRTPTVVTDMAGNAWVVWCAFNAANNYALVYKAYNGSAWDAGATTLVASGTNINYPNGGFGNNTLGVTYTQGTATPWTIGWVTVVFVALSATFAGVGTLTGTTSLTTALACEADGIGTLSGALSAGGVTLAVTMAGVGTLSGTTTLTTALATTLAGVGTLVGPLSAALTLPGTTLAGVGTLTPALSANLTLPVTTMAGIGTLTGATTLKTALATTLAGVGTLAGATSLSTALSASLVGVGTLTGTLSTTGAVALTGTLAGVGTLTGTATLKTALTTTLVGAGTLSGVFTIRIALSLTFAGLGTLAGTITLPISSYLSATWLTRDMQTVWVTRDELGGWRTRDESAAWGTRDEQAAWDSRDEQATWKTRS